MKLWLRRTANGRSNRLGRRLPRRVPTEAWSDADPLDLDEVSPDNPVFLQDFSRHTPLGEYRGVRLAGVDETTPVPAGSLMPVARTAPDRHVMEGAQALVQRAPPALTRERREQAIRSAVPSCRARASRASPTRHGSRRRGTRRRGYGRRGLATYADLAARGELGVRVNASPPPTPMSGSAAGFRTQPLEVGSRQPADPRLFRVLGVKVFADGIPPSKHGVDARGVRRVAAADPLCLR